MAVKQKKAKEDLKSSLQTPFKFLRYKASETQINSPHHSFRVTYKHQKPRYDKPVLSARKLSLEVWQKLNSNKKLFFGLLAIYIGFSWLLIGGASEASFNNYKQVISDVSQNQASSLYYGGTLFLAAISGSYNSSLTDLQRFLGFMMGLLFFMILVWALRSSNTDKTQKITIRQSLYNGSTPLIPELLVLFVVGLQAVPAVAGILVLSLINNQSFKTDGIESMAFALGSILLIILSVYWLINSAVAMIIVTLPNMYPLSSFSLAKQLVDGRRFSILLRLLFMGLAVVLLWAIILLPIIYLDSKLSIVYLPLISITIQILIGLSLLAATTYVYRLYRNLL